MAFECNTDIDLTKNSEHSIEVDSNHIASCEKSVQIGIETPITDDAKPESLADWDHSRVITKAPVNEHLSNYSSTITDLPPALISEIFNCLDPKVLGVVSCVSPDLYRIASDHHIWKEFYFKRWGLLPFSLSSETSDEKSWEKLLLEWEFRSKTFMGRYTVDTLNGHSEAVRTVCILPSKKLLFTSGYDSVIRMFDLEEGLSIASSQPLGCTIRAVAVDSNVLVAGGSDGFIHGWKAEKGHPHLFNIKVAQNQSRNHNTEFRLWEHEGPITCLALDSAMIYSGSWDMTIRVWDRFSLKCLKVLMHNDWVWSLVPLDTTVVTTSGSDVYIWETNTGSLVEIITKAHVGNTYSLARSHTGSFLFTGGEDGKIHMFDVNSNVRRVATWSPHTGPVYSLAFEFPWLVSASSDGRLSLIDVRKLLKTIRKSTSKVNRVDRNGVEPPQRMLHGFGCNLFSVAMGADRIVCGGEDGVVRIWDFSEALEMEKRVTALRGLRLENRMRRRKLQSEIDSKGSRADQCSIAAKNQMNGERNGVWYNKRGLTRKVKG